MWKTYNVRAEKPEYTKEEKITIELQLKTYLPIAMTKEICKVAVGDLGKCFELK
jgi:hypothetical protein